MPVRSKRRVKEMKPDLIPIMDGVFIMIFFLLAIGNFIKINEIGSDLPIYRVNANPNPEKLKFSLRVLISKTNVKLINDVNQDVLFESDFNSDPKLGLLSQKVIELKQKYSDQDRAIITPEENVQYLQLVKVLDAVRQYRPAGLDTENVKLFNQFVFENE